uniref:ORF6 n=1 Tax=Nitrosopumilaceae spindle-shaped virus TaxID=3065433 RepID=A0AAT9JAB9_9VIRU
MGVLHGRDLLSSKWITAIISDASHRVHFIPIKHTIGDYFITDIDGDVYAFKIDGRRILQYREGMVKTFRVLQYDISHHLPLSPETKELEIILELNKLPKVDGMLANIIKILGSKERDDFVSHKLVELIDKIQGYEKVEAQNELSARYSKEALNMINYLDHLDVKEIVTPLRKVSEFIQEDLIATDPKFMGTVVASYQRTDMEHKKVTNTPLQTKQAWIKFLAIFMGIGLVGVIGFVIYDGGHLDSMMGGMSMPSLGQISDDVIMKQYPDGESLRIAVDSGEVDYTKLSSVAQGVVDEHREAHPVIIMPDAEPPVVIEEPEVPVQPEEIIEPVIIEVEPVLIESP